MQRIGNWLNAEYDQVNEHIPYCLNSNTTFQILVNYSSELDE